MTQFLYISGERDAGLLDRPRKACEDFRAASGCAPLRSIATAGGTLFANHFPAEPVGQSAVREIHVFGECYPDDSTTEKSGTLPEKLQTIVERTGASGLAGLNGRYAIVFEDGRTVFLAGDVGGFWPTYWAVAGGRLFVGSNPLLVKEALGGSPLDPVGVAQSLRFGHQLGERTLWSRVKTCPPGSVMQWDGGNFRTVSVSRLPFGARGFGSTVEGAAEELAETLRHSVSLRTAGRSVGIPLSNGLDSRTVAALARDCAESCSAFTYDWNGAINLVWARRVTRRLGIPHEVVRVRAQEVAHSVPATWAILGGTCDVHPAYLHAAMGKLRHPAPCQASGFMGETVTGYDVKHCLVGGRMIAEEQLFSSWQTLASESYLSEEEAGRVARLLGVRPADTMAREAYDTATASCDALWQKRIAWEFLGRQRRYTSFIPRLLEERWDVATPFIDTRMMRLCLGWPVALLWRQAAYRLFHSKHLPGLEYFPRAWNPDWRARERFRSKCSNWSGRIRNRFSRHKDKPRWDLAARALHETPVYGAYAKLQAECEACLDTRFLDIDLRSFALATVVMSATF